MPNKFLGDNMKPYRETYSKSDNPGNLGKFRENDERNMEAYRLQNNGQKSIKLDKNTEEGRKAIKAINDSFFGRNSTFQVEANNILNKQAETHYIDNINTATFNEILDDIRAMDVEILTTVSNNADNIARSPSRNTNDWRHFSTNLDQIVVYKNNPGTAYGRAAKAYRDIEKRYMNGDYNDVIANDWETLTSRPDQRSRTETTELIRRYQDLL